MRAFHENDDETKKKEIKIFFAKALSEKVSRTLAWSLEEEENGCLSSLEELMQEVKEWRFQVLIFFGEWRDSDEINLTSMNDHLIAMLDVSKVAISGCFGFSNFLTRNG